jgi:hypothetical protein
MKHLLVATMALALAACGSAGDDDASSAEAASFRVPTVGDESVAAVLDSPGMPVAQLRFLIDTQPVVGKPFLVRLTASATSAVSRLQVAADSDSLLVEPASAVLELALDESSAGTSRTYKATQDLMVLAKQGGLAAVSVRIATGPDSTETVYSIPVLVAEAGTGTAAPVTASDEPDPAAKADNGQP